MDRVGAPPTDSAPTPVDLRGRTLRGFLLIAGQRGVALAVTGLGGIALARLLTPDLFGVYAVITFVVGLALSFGDLGLAAALLQQRRADPAAVLPGAFLLHLSVAIGFALALVLLAPRIADWLNLSPSAVPPLRCLSLLLPMAVFRMPAAVLLERDLRYFPLALADSLETATYHATAILAAMTGAGVWSFVLGALGGRLVGVGALLATTRWRPAWRWDWSALAPILRFGIFFQGNTLLTIVRDAVVPTYVAAACGVTAVGYLTWAMSVAFLPLQLVSMAGRVLFPALSSLQGQPLDFARATERALNRVASLLYPASLFLLAGADQLVLAVYGERWLPAVSAIRLFCITAVVGGTSSLFVHGLYGLGRADLVFRLNLLWTALIWLCALILVPRLGFMGFAWTSALVALTGAWSATCLRQRIPLHLLASLRGPLLAALAGGMLFAGLAHRLGPGLGMLAVAAGLSLGVYAALLAGLEGRPWRAELAADWRAIRQGFPYAR